MNIQNVILCVLDAYYLIKTKTSSEFFKVPYNFKNVRYRFTKYFR